MNKTIFLILGAVLLLSSCRKDKEIITPPVVTVNPGILIDYEPTVTPITGSVDGFVTDENGDAVQSASVKLGTQTTITNEDGHFAFLNTNMNKAGTLIQVTHAGYFDGSRRFLPTGNGVDRVRIQLLEKDYDQSFSSNTGGDIAIPGGTGTIRFTPNTIIDGSGNAYSGTVDIAVKYLDPTAAVTGEQMPGDLFGVDQNIEEQMLRSFGMIAVEMVDGAGNPLNLGEDATARVTMPVPASILSNAPATIPLWSYNEQYGVWVEEGEATLTNGVYVGEVTHFSWWNIDVPGEFINLTVTVIDQNGNTLPNYSVQLTSPSLGVGFSSPTNSAGQSTGLIPAGEVLIATVSDDICNIALLTQNIGPFSNSNSTVTLTVNLASHQATIIAGTAECSGVPLNDYLLKVFTPNRTEYLYGSTPTFTWSQIYCGGATNYSIKVINVATTEESNLIPISAGVLNNLGAVDACQNQLQDYIAVNIDGDNFLYFLSYNFIDVNKTIINGSAGNQGYCRIDFSGSTSGAYPNIENSVQLTVNSSSDIYKGNFSVLDVTINGSKATGTFGGSLDKNNSGVMVPVSGTFDIDLCTDVTAVVGNATCSGSTVNEVLVGINKNGFDSYYHSPIDFGYLECNGVGSSTLTVYDVVSKTKSAPITITEATANNLGNIDACQTSLSEYISLIVDGQNYLIPYVVDSSGVTLSRIQGNTKDVRIDIEFNGGSTGSYPGTQNDIHLRFTTFNSNVYYSGNISTFDVTTYNTTEIIGSFSGTLDAWGGGTVPVSGSFDCDL